ncbi:MAG TPA: helix-turn-helix domain-containing protein [Candidatus Agrococcus pullicola]|uniref:Helix-turn-helix domain-containing protein n=1 Tax=Candidatus Agrococcus pullicola TaxID=2838429 RepID=A0A9D2CB66_9MICO|nr:helix-turn-helix domain-containing protein [Candidatus Agrococcus pullicola]
MPTLALVLHGDSMLYETAIAAEVLGVDRAELTAHEHWYDFFICTPRGDPSPWLPHVDTRPYAALTGADTVVVSSTSELLRPPDTELIAALRRAYENGSRVAALCTGAFILAAAGILDGRPATTHWMHAELLSSEYPRVRVLPDVLYVDDGAVLTSAGKTAALDLCLHLLHLDFGASAANGIARRLVMPSRREGGQGQFIAPPPSPTAGAQLKHALEWARSNLDAQITVQQIARQAALSPRQLARRMIAEVGMRPLDWLQRERLWRAQELLESTDFSVEHIAALCGMGTATTLRRHFSRALGVTPTSYRGTFHMSTGQH